MSDHDVVLMADADDLSDGAQYLGMLIFSRVTEFLAEVTFTN